MAESDLFMLCDEDDLAPCQSITEDTSYMHCSDTAAHNDTTQSPAQPDGISTEQTSAASHITRHAVSMTAAPAVANALLSNVIQPIQRAVGGSPGQTIYITTQTNPGQSLASSMNLGTPVGYILNGQPVTFLTAAQAPRLIAPRMVTPGNAPQTASSGNISAVQIPVSLTLACPSRLQSITSAAPGMTHLSMTPSTILPITTPRLPGVPVKVNAGGAAPAVNLPVQPARAITVSNNTTTSAPTQLPSGGLSQTRRQTQNPARPSVTANKVFKRCSNLPTTCVRCKFSYKLNKSLRGYFCQCNRELTESIQQLQAQAKKRKTKHHSNRPKPSTSETHVSFSKSSESSSLKHVTTSEIPEGAPSPGTGDVDNQGRLIMLVEDYFYGQHPGCSAQTEINQEPIMMKCHLCNKKLKNNIKLMNHMKHHMDLERQKGDMEYHTMCQHCYRNFPTPFQLQCHLEMVHSQVESSKVCKICEWSFDNEPLLLNHMKLVHRPGEMPYMCQVCKFRSSFYQDVINHFREKHKNTSGLLCPYCLKVFKSSNGYQLHYSKHKRKSVLHCGKCRLQFLFAKNKVDHRQQLHTTFIKPKQLEGLEPGTRVIIRAYAVNKDYDNRELVAPQINTPTPSEEKSTSDLSPRPPAPQNVIRKNTPTKKKPVESIVELMVKFQRECKQTGKLFCMECNYEIPDFSNHFPTYVRCSLCHYCTCCSRAYANHMISFHVPRKSTTKYIALYKPCPKKGQLSCTACKYKTQVGDLMAKHLADHPDHFASKCTLCEGFSQGYKRFVFIPTDLIRGGQRLNSRFLLQVGKSSLPLSSKPLPRPSYTITLPVRPASTPSLPIQIQPADQSSVPHRNSGAKSNGNQVDTERTAEKSLSLAQLKVVLYALCCGIPQAASHFDTKPEVIQSWILKRQREPLTARERLTPQAADRLVEWVLCRREQQLPIDEANLFSKASEFNSIDGWPGISYDWVVDFMLRHDLGLQAFATSSKALPRKSQELERSFSRFLHQHVTSQNFRQAAIGAMDELSIFINMEQLDKASADSSSMAPAFKLMGTAAPLIDVMFTALADGTMLSTMIFLRGEPLSPDAPSLPDFIILEARPEGFTDEERLQIWYDKVWHRHVNPSSGGKGFLLLDTYKGHVGNEFLAALNSANTLPGLIPQSCSRRLQPLETCMGPVLREFLQARWSQHETAAPQDLVGAEPADLALLLSGWLIEMLDVLTAEPKLLFRSFERILSNSQATPKEPSELVRSLTEALIVSKLQEDEAEREQSGDNGKSSNVVPWPSPSTSILALKKIFEKDSDLESFHGFEDTELIDH